eukprot:2278692-Pyramimonas_sp.AAC.1
MVSDHADVVLWSCILNLRPVSHKKLQRASKSPRGKVLANCGHLQSRRCMRRKWPMHLRTKTVR